MDLSLTDDQNLLVSAFNGLLDRYREPPIGSHGYVLYSPEFQQELSDSGFTTIAEQPGYGLLEAAMLVEAAAACPTSAEAAASMMIGPLVGRSTGPVALAWEIGKPARYLTQARTLILFEGDDVLVATPTDADRTPLESIAAYPLARLDRIPADAVRCTAETASAIRRRALVGIAAEAAGLMRGALEATVKHVKDRQQFGQPLGNFQAIQHRLAEDAQIVRANCLLAFRAAWQDSEKTAATAALYSQVTARKIIYDCHQFSGAMGLTLEYPLHLWTYRLKYLQGEAGGRVAQSAKLAKAAWN